MAEDLRAGEGLQVCLDRGCARVFSWPPVRLRLVQGGVGRSRSLISSPPYNQLWGDYIDMLVSIEDEAARPQVKLEEQGVFFQYETAYLW